MHALLDPWKFVSRNPASQAAFSATVGVALVYMLVLTVVTPVTPLRALPVAGFDKSFSVDSTDAPWPSEPAAISVWGSGVIESNSGSRTMPMASIAKIICALVSLDLKPMESTAGETYLLGPKDSTYYNDFLKQDGSVAPVVEGLKLTRQQMLELMILPSSNNYTLSYVDWMFGSNEAYLNAASAYLRKHGLTEISVVESSGFSSGNVASARSLIQVGALALANPVLVDIMAKKSVIIPGIGEILSTNPLLDGEAVRGIKTGTTTSERKNLLLAQDFMVSDRKLTAIVVTLDQPSDQHRVSVTRALAQYVTQLTQTVTLVSPGEVVARSTSWDGKSIELVATRGETVTLALGDTVRRTINLNPVQAGFSANSPVGDIIIEGLAGTQRIPVVTRTSIQTPDAWWRITHPFDVMGWLTAQLGLNL